MSTNNFFWDWLGVVVLLLVGVGILAGFLAVGFVLGWLLGDWGLALFAFLCFSLGITLIVRN